MTNGWVASIRGSSWAVLPLRALQKHGCVYVHARTSEFAPNDYLTRLGLHRVVGTPEARDAAVGGDICDQEKERRVTGSFIITCDHATFYNRTILTHSATFVVLTHWVIMVDCDGERRDDDAMMK